MSWPAPLPTPGPVVTYPGVRRSVGARLVSASNITSCAGRLEFLLPGLLCAQERTRLGRANLDRL